MSTADATPIQDVREAMKNYWSHYAKGTTVKEMMLDSEGEFLCQVEQPEISEMLPELKGKRVLELGAGIGRFTTQFADMGVAKVIAVDFMENFAKKNEETNGHRENVQVLQADVTQLQYEPQSFDFVFSNWLLMYLSDEEVLGLFRKIITWLTPRGFFFFRESCFHQSGNAQRDGGNPSRYRSPAQYNSMLDKAAGEHRFELALCKPLQAYINFKNNPNQYCWLVEKMQQDNHLGFDSFQAFLDQKQYSLNGILRYEKIFGDGYISTGGVETTKEFAPMLDVKATDIVLDVGCGIGGGAFFLSDTYGAEVLGIDLSANMISIALERAEGRRGKVQFELGDITRRNYRENSFDVIYSRDVILHIKDKKTLFTRFLSWLKPGGRLFITDYCCGDGEWNEDFKTYVEHRGYALLSPKQYGKAVEEVGFDNVRAEDRTDQFVWVLQNELRKFENIKEQFVAQFCEEDFNYIADGWKDKLKRCAAGDQKWGLILAWKKAEDKQS